MTTVHAQYVVFHAAKAGSTATEWEDGAGYDPGDPANGRPARLVVLDGATEAYDSIRWVGQLVDSFLGVEAESGSPALTAPALDNWFGAMQQRWLERSPAQFASIFEERKFRDHGSFATLLGCQLDGLGTGTPRWRAAAVGDAVLFHVRGERLVCTFPALTGDDFGLSPDGLSTLPGQRARMRDRLRFAAGELAPEDRLYLATDAMAAWIVRRCEAGRPPWTELDALRHPAEFEALAATELAAGRLKNDDLTLLRVRLSAEPAGALLVCR